MKIPFTLDAWLKDKSQNVETRDGRLVHNIWRIKEPSYKNNRKAEVCALIDGEEDALVFFEGGRYLPSTKDTDSPFDLFIVTPEPKLTKFELQLLDWLSSDTCGEIPMEKMKECVKVRASELLDLVKKELVDDMQLQFNEAYYRGRKDGKAEALKDLPRWEDIKTGDRVLIHCKSTRDEAFKHIYDNQEGKVLHIWDLKGNSWGNIHVKIEGGYNNGFLLEELEKLPRFKED